MRVGVCGARGVRCVWAVGVWAAAAVLALLLLTGQPAAWERRGARPQAHGPAAAAAAAARRPLAEPAAPPSSSTSTPAPTPPPPPLLATDPRRQTDEAARDEAQRALPSLPLHFWHRHQADKDRFYKKKDCAPFPSVYELEFHNTYWQSLRSSNGTFHLFGAYLDARPASRLGPAVRILAVHDRLRPTLATHCQLWFEARAEPALVRVLEYKYVWNSKWGNYQSGLLQPYLLACVLPAELSALRPAAVSLVERACDRASNLLRVHHETLPEPPPQPQGFAVCVKGLDFLHEDLSVRLVEWVEMVRLLGADKVYFYELQVHPNISKVLAHYEAAGVAERTRITLPGGQPNLPGLQHMYLKKKTTRKRQMELIPYNDCLYRNMYRHRWLALLDIDEIIVPLLDGDWPALLRRALPLAAPKPRSSYHASNLYYLDSLQHAHGWEPSVPRYLHMMQHVHRTRNHTKPGTYVKAFHETGRVLALHNHFPLACIGGACSSYPLDTAHARLQHYRADCVTSLKSCAALRADAVRDETLWRWKEALVPRADRVLRALGFLQPGPPASSDPSSGTASAGGSSNATLAPHR